MSAIGESMRVYGSQSVNGGDWCRLILAVFADFHGFRWFVGMSALKPRPELAFPAI
jgi:hypothetical protein